MNNIYYNRIKKLHKEKLGVVSKGRRSETFNLNLKKFQYLILNNHIHTFGNILMWKASYMC